MSVDSYGAKHLPGGAVLTEAEHDLMNRLSGVVAGFTAVYEADVQRGEANAETHSHDMNEVVAHIHDLQARVLSRAAARSYPRYRLL